MISVSILAGWLVALGIAFPIIVGLGVWIKEPPSEMIKAWLGLAIMTGLPATTISVGFALWDLTK